MTGFPPNLLLMTSIYDNIFEEDLPGFYCVKTQFWDHGQLGVPVYLRRRSIGGEWIWLESKAKESQNINVGHDEGDFTASKVLPVLILQETVVKDVELAKVVHRSTRITSLLIQAVETADQTDKHAKEPLRDEESDLESQIVGEDTAAYQRIMDNFRKGAPVPEDLHSIFHLMQTETNDNVSDSGPMLEIDTMHNFEKQKEFDPNSMVESIRQGVRLDLGLTRLAPAEVKVVALVLSGRIKIRELAPLVKDSLQQGSGMEAISSQFSLESEQISASSKRSGGNASHRYIHHSQTASSPTHAFPKQNPPQISVLNLSYTYIGNAGIEMLAEVLHIDGSALRTLDISFCSMDEKGLLLLAKAISKRKRKKIPFLKGVILSGNYISPVAASVVGSALSPSEGNGRNHKRIRGRDSDHGRTGYDSDSTESDFDEDEDFVQTRKRKGKSNAFSEDDDFKKKGDGLRVLHVANASMTAETTKRLLEGLGASCPVRELNLSSNDFGETGASELDKFLNMKQRSRNPQVAYAMPNLDRLDMSNNCLGDMGTKHLTCAIQRGKRSPTNPDNLSATSDRPHLVDLKLSSNSIGHTGVELLLKQLLQRKLVSLSLDKNCIGDQGCQLVAASLKSMPSLSRLNLAFNQIGSRGITSLMRSLVMCKSIKYLGLSGNILKIQGAIALAFTLTKHPRLEELDLDNCCLGQAAQCHIVAGIISNRWVPMKRLNGYAVAPPMVAMGALEPRDSNASNEECFRIRKDKQMEAILQWIESNKTAKAGGPMDPNVVGAGFDTQHSRYLPPDFVSKINDVHGNGTPSQNEYLRLLGWLTQIPFDDDELTSLQKYFYDADGGEGDRGSDGLINLKLRGDLLAALDGETADEMRDEPLIQSIHLSTSVGIDLEKLFVSDWNAWDAFQGTVADRPPLEFTSGALAPFHFDEVSSSERVEVAPMVIDTEVSDVVKAISTADQPEIMETSASALSVSGKDRKGNKIKPRITMFPQFEQRLEDLKATATHMLDEELDEMQADCILTQYAEASLTILRQLRYHCMNSGLDGWRQTGLTRKILIVDDSKTIRAMVSRAFEDAGFIVDTAADGAEGVEKLKASLYDIAFMDIDMPVMDGFEATTKLREWEDVVRPGVRQPICALTASYVDNFEKSHLRKFKEAGLDVMESKPCNIPRLLKVVDDVSPMFSDLTISIMQRERSDQSFASGSSSEQQQQRY